MKPRNPPPPNHEVAQRLSVHVHHLMPTHRAPTHPGEMLLHEFLIPWGMPQTEFARRIGVSYPRVNEIIKGKRGVTPDTALRLARFNVEQAGSAKVAFHGLPSPNAGVTMATFYTFTQIAFLVDTYQGKVKEYRFVHYLLFITYFPHLIAGPVLHHAEMMPQFERKESYRQSAANVAIGLSIFAIGLAKKVLIADNLSPHANFFFNQSDPQGLLVAWGGVLAYAFQLYFDFSGYSDMAIGISRIFGIRLPLNFDTPYRSASIVEFWRRWHISLSRFLRDYLYVALGGNRKGRVRRYVNLMLTMLLGGLWHGASWTFVIWGGLHGFYLVVNHGWQWTAGTGTERRSRSNA